MASSCSGRKEEKDALHQKFVLGVQNYRHHLLVEGKKAESWKFHSKPYDQLRGTL